MSQPDTLIGPMVAGGRRITAAPEWPVVAGTSLGLLAVVEVVFRTGSSGPDLTVAMLLGLATTVPLALFRAQVVTATAAITAATLLTLAVSQPVTGAGLVALLVAFYITGRRQAGWVPALMLLPLIGYALLGAFGTGSGNRLLVWSLVAATVASAGLGTLRSLRDKVAERNVSRQTMSETLLEHAARGERARIARELHDVVAHHISMIAVQAETARLATPGLPADGAKRLLAIGDTARSALTEMRRLLGVLREDVDGEAASRKPQPGLHELNELVDEARDAAGGSIRLIVRGRVRPLDPGVELTAYRIVQEALTNARRYARGAAVDVELDYTADALELWIRDNGLGRRDATATRARQVSPVGGHGLLGMRERVATVGGDLRAGPISLGGFLVEATLPGARDPIGTAPTTPPGAAG